LRKSSWFASLTCSWECSKGFPDARICWVRREFMLSSMSMSMSMRKRMKLTLRDLEVRGKRVLVRVDFNVPLEERDRKIVITDDTRIRESLPTINWLREHGAKTILMSHFGRPKGKRVDKYTLRPVADYLHTLINQPV